MPRKRIVPEAPPTETYQPTDTITLDIADRRVVAYEALPEPDVPEKPLPRGRTWRICPTCRSCASG